MYHLLENPRERIASEIDRLTLEHAVCSTALIAMRPFDGKVINKKLATAVEAALPKRLVTLESVIGAYRMQIWGNGIHFDNRMSILFPAQTSPPSARKQTYSDNLFRTVWAARYMEAHPKLITQLYKRLGTLDSDIAMYQAALERLETVVSAFDESRNLLFR